MPVFTVASVSGSLGVTTLSVGLALTWPRPVVLVEADPSGGSAILAGYCTGVARPGLSELGAGAPAPPVGRRAAVAALPPGRLEREPVAWLRAHQQAASLLGVRDALLDALRGLEADTGVCIVVDAGRLGMVGSPEPLISESDVTLVASGTGLPELARVRSWLPGLREGSMGDVRWSSRARHVGTARPRSPRPWACRWSARSRGIRTPRGGGPTGSPSVGSTVRRYLGPWWRWVSRCEPSRRAPKTRYRAPGRGRSDDEAAAAHVG